MPYDGPAVSDNSADDGKPQIAQLVKGAPTVPLISRTGKIRLKPDVPASAVFWIVYLIRRECVSVNADRPRYFWTKLAAITHIAQ